MHSSRIHAAFSTPAASGAWHRRRFYMSGIDRMSTRSGRPRRGSAAISSHAVGRAPMMAGAHGVPAQIVTLPPPKIRTLGDLAAAVRPYIAIARIDHWFKNAFMILGIVLACFYEPQLMNLNSVPPLLLAVAATCLIASSNYVLNELLDGPRDRLH